MAAQPPPPNKWISWLSQIYSSGKGPVLGTVDVQEIEDKAREVMKDNSSMLQRSDGGAEPEQVLTAAYLYTLKSAGTCSTDDANRKAFDRWKLVPRVLNNVTLRNIEASALEMIVAKGCLIPSIRRQFWA
jgi:hypothetical protein